MKKITLFALAALLVLLAGCKKENKQEPQPEEDLITNNPVVEVLKYSKTLYGLDSTQVVTKLVADGWIKSTGTENYATYAKDDNGFMAMLGFACEEGAVNDLMATMVNQSSNVTLSDAKLLKGTMQYVGENFTMGSYSWPFWMMAYEEGGNEVDIESYSEALAKVLTVAENGDLSIGWRDADTHGFMLAQRYYASSKMNYIIFVIK